VSLIGFAHCPRCGNVRLSRVSRDRAGYGLGQVVAKLLRIPAYRCEPCRLKFFTVRPTLKILSTQTREGETNSTHSTEATK
jgi:hypothetical protein